MKSSESSQVTKKTLLRTHSSLGPNYSTAGKKFRQPKAPEPRTAVSNFLGTRDWFCGRQFFHGPGWGMVSGWFKHITFKLLSFCEAQFLTGWNQCWSKAQRCYFISLVNIHSGLSIWYYLNLPTSNSLSLCLSLHLPLSIISVSVSFSFFKKNHLGNPVFCFSSATFCFQWFKNIYGNKEHSIFW